MFSKAIGSVILYMVVEDGITWVQFEDKANPDQFSILTGNCGNFIALLGQILEVVAANTRTSQVAFSAEEPRRWRIYKRLVNRLVATGYFEAKFDDEELTAIVGPSEFFYSTQ